MIACCHLGEGCFRDVRSCHDGSAPLRWGIPGVVGKWPEGWRYVVVVVVWMCLDTCALWFRGSYSCSS